MEDNFLIHLDEQTVVSSRVLKLATRFVQTALAAAFVSVVADRYGLWGSTGAEAILGSLLPEELLRVGTWIASLVEILLVLALLTGWQLRWATLLGAILLLLHAIVMFVSLGLAAPLGYFVLSGASAAFLLFALQRSLLERRSE